MTLRQEGSALPVQPGLLRHRHPCQGCAGVDPGRAGELAEGRVLPQGGRQPGRAEPRRARLGGRAADGRKQYWSGLRFLTERALSREMENLEPPFLRQKGDGPYRATWASHDDYLNDLLTFLFHAMNYDPQYGAELETRGDWLVDRGRASSSADRPGHLPRAAGDLPDAAVPAAADHGRPPPTATTASTTRSPTTTPARSNRGRRSTSRPSPRAASSFARASRSSSSPTSSPPSPRVSPCTTSATRRAGILGDEPAGQPARHGRPGDHEQLPRTGR